LLDPPLNILIITCFQDNIFNFILLFSREINNKMCINSHIMIEKIRGSYWRCVLSEEEERPSMKKREYSGGIFVKNRN